jgi:hypothetical protein
MMRTLGFGWITTAAVFAVAGTAMAQPADCRSIADGPSIAIGLEIPLGDQQGTGGQAGRVTPRRGANGTGSAAPGTAWVDLGTVPAQGSHCQTAPLPTGDTLRGPPGDVLHGASAPGGLLAGPPAGVVSVGPARTIRQP